MARILLWYGSGESSILSGGTSLVMVYVVNKNIKKVPSNKWMSPLHPEANEYPFVIHIPWTTYEQFYNHYVLAESNGIDCLHSYSSDDDISVPLLGGPANSSKEEWYFRTAKDAVFFKMLV